MIRSVSLTVWFLILASGLPSSRCDAASRLPQDSSVPAPLAATSPTLAPFQHVRFCLRYPDECKSNVEDGDGIIDLTDENSDLLDRVNRDVNAAIIPVRKGYRTNLRDGWTIAPATGDCNDYAVTKRHELLRYGLPAKALRLAVVMTASGVGHLVLLAATTKGDLVLDNLTDAIRPWQTADYHWLKIQSARDPKLWYETKVSAASPAQGDRKPRVAYP
jgi:predicted transglutaminase-like cysteine proteinase